MSLPLTADNFIIIIERAVITLNEKRFLNKTRSALYKVSAEWGVIMYLNLYLNTVWAGELHYITEMSTYASYTF